MAKATPMESSLNGCSAYIGATHRVRLSVSAAIDARVSSHVEHGTLCKRHGRAHSALGPQLLEGCCSGPGCWHWTPPLSLSFSFSAADPATMSLTDMCSNEESPLARAGRWLSFSLPSSLKSTLLPATRWWPEGGGWPPYASICLYLAQPRGEGAPVVASRASGFWRCPCVTCALFFPPSPAGKSFPPSVDGVWF